MSYRTREIVIAEVSTDGKTTWVNAPNCVGRFGPHAYEVGVTSFCEPLPTDTTQLIQAWEYFKALIEQWYRAKLIDTDAPTAVQKAIALKDLKT